MVVKCCCSVGGKPCTRGEVIREVSAKQLERWASKYNTGNNRDDVVSYDAKRSGSKPMVCSYHACDMLGVLTTPAYFEAVTSDGGRKPPKPQRRDVVKCVLKAAHSHEKQLAKDAEQARVSMDTSTPPPPPWTRARVQMIYTASSRSRWPLYREPSTRRISSSSR